MPSNTLRRHRRLDAMDVLARLGISDVQSRTLVAAGNNEVAIPAEADIAHAAHRAIQGAHARQLVRVPQVHHGVAATGGEPAAGRTQSQRRAGRGVRLDGGQCGQLRRRRDARVLRIRAYLHLPRAECDQDRVVFFRALCGCKCRAVGLGDLREGGEGGERGYADWDKRFIL